MSSVIRPPGQSSGSGPKLGGTSSGPKGGIRPPGGSKSSGSSSGGQLQPTGPAAPTSTTDILLRGQSKGKPSILGQIGDAVSSIPSGIAGLAEGAATEVKHGGLAGPRLPATAQEATSGQYAQANKPFQSQVRAAQAGWEGQQSGADVAGHPLTASFAGSFHRTANDVRDPERFVDAYNHGQIVGKLLEDAGNVALVGGVAAKALDVASAGGYSAAATAQNTAEAASKVVPISEKAAADAGKLVAEHEQTVAALKTQVENLSPAERQSILPRIQGQITRAQAGLSQAQDVAAQAAEQVAKHQATATGAAAEADRLAGQAGLGYRAYRAANTISNVGNQGASLPAKPFEYLSKTLGAPAKAFFAGNPVAKTAVEDTVERTGVLDAARHALGNVGERSGLAGLARNHSLVKDASAQVAQVNADQQQVAAHLQSAVGRIDQITGHDPVILQAAQAVAAGQGEAIARQVELLGPAAETGGVAALAAAAKHLGMDPRAAQIAVDMALGRADPQVVAQIEAVNHIYDTQIKPWSEGALMDTNQVRQRPMTPGQVDNANWSLTGTGLSPATQAEVARRTDAEAARLGGKQDDLTAKLAKRAEKVGVEPGTTPAEAGRRLAAQTGTDTTTQGLKGRLGALRDVGAAEGRADAYRNAAERFSGLREQIPASVDDATVARVAEAGDRYVKARDSLHTATSDPAVTAPDLVAHVRNLRSSVADAVQAERVALSDMPVDRVPFVPGDLSEHHAQLLEKLGVANEQNLIKTIDARVAKMRGVARATYDRDPGALWVKTYNAMYERLPAAARAVLEKMSPSEVRAMRESWAAGTHRIEIGGLDTLAQQWLGDAAQHAADGGIGQFIDDFARRGQLEAAANAIKSNRWGPMTYDLLRGALHDGAALLDDPEARIALGAGDGRNLAEITAELAAHRATVGVPFPHPDDLNAAVAHLPFPLDDNEALTAIAHSLDGPDGAQFNAFRDAWVRAGEPPLNATVNDLLDGQEPSWAHPVSVGAVDQPTLAEGSLGGQSATVGTEAAPQGMEALQAQEAAHSEISQTLAEKGGQALDPVLAREASILTGQATRNENLAEKKVSGAEQSLVSAAAEKGAKGGVKGGRALEKYAKTFTDLKRVNRQIEALPDFTQREVDKMFRVLENNPARTRPAIKMASEFTGEIAKWRAEVAQQIEDGVPGADPALLNTLDETIAASINDVRDIFDSYVQTPSGDLVAGPPRFDPQFRIGGQPFGENLAAGKAPKGTGEGAASKLRAAKGAREKIKSAQFMPRSVDEMRAVLRSRIARDTTNRATRLLDTTYGHYAAGVIGDVTGMKSEEIAAEMKARGYVPWDTENAMFQQPGVKDIGPATRFVPTPIFNSAVKWYGPTGEFEKFMRRYYDKPLTWWRAGVLALRPAWHVNNIVGRGFMAMLGEGMSPAAYAERMGQAKALMGLDRARLDMAFPESATRSGPFAGRRLAAATNGSHLAKLEAKVGTIEPGTRAALGVNPTDEAIPTAPTIPGRVIQGRAGASAGTVDEMGNVQKANPLSRVVQGSYRMHGVVDDMDRLAVFLDSRAKMTAADVANLRTKNPELAGLSNSAIRTEGAVRVSLKVAGDFLRMSPVERQVFRRVVPFYVWMRHITQLALRLPVYNPARTIWTLHLAEMFGTPAQYGLVNSVPGGGGLIQLPKLNPFGDYTTFDPQGLGFNLSPAIKIGLGSATGLDTDTMAQFQRPPGQPGGYGGQPGMTPLIDTGITTGKPGVRLGELANLIGQNVPLVRVARGVKDTFDEGQPVMRYPLGQVRRTAKTQGAQPIGSGEPVLGPLARYFGVPYVRQPNRYEKSDLAAKKAAKPRAKASS